MTPKWIFLALNALFQTHGSNTSLLASPLGQASLKGISKLIHPQQNFWFPALITKEYISFHPHYLLWANGTTIPSFAQAKNLCHPWLDLPYFSYPIDQQVLWSHFKKYVSHPPTTLYFHWLHLSPRHHHLLPVLFEAPLSKLLPLFFPGHPFSTLQPEWTFKSINHIMSSSAYIPQCFPSLEENRRRKPKVFSMAHRPCMCRSFLCVWAHHLLLQFTHYVILTPFLFLKHSKLAPTSKPLSRSSRLEWSSLTWALHWLLGMQISAHLSLSQRGLPDHSTGSAPRAEVRVGVT